MVFLVFFLRFNENITFLWERRVNLLKSFLLCRVKRSTQEGRVPGALQPSRNNLDSGKESG